MYKERHSAMQPIAMSEGDDILPRVYIRLAICGGEREVSSGQEAVGRGPDGMDVSRPCLAIISTIPTSLIWRRY